jgi:hypothetical protein
MDSRELTFGDTVVVVAAAPAECRPGNRAFVVGLPDECYPLVTIEFGDGSSIGVRPDLVVRQTEQL